ncbi:MAG: EpsG family protein [Flavobacterium sp.]|nr:EpsG family protein [Flavobacterium sp.]MDD5151732.1 EpsG family protein [Flavobacterium sp.]
MLLAFFFASKDLNISYEKRRLQFIKVCIFLLILQSGLRNWAVGADTYQYFLRFESAKGESWQDLVADILNFEGKDPFYTLFQKFFQLFSSNYQWYLIFVALIFMPALGYFIYKNTTKIRHALLAFIIYMGNFYGFFSITGIRQTISTALLLWSYQYIKERKLLVFTILVLFAGLFHLSALIFFPLYFVAELKRPKLIFRLALFGFPFAMVFKNQLAVFFVRFIDAQDRFGVYSEQYEKGGSYVLTAFHVLLAIWALGLFTKMMSIVPTTYRMYNTFALALFFFPLQWVNPSAGRIAQYFTIVIMIWIPYLLDAASMNQPKRREFLYIITIIFLISATLFAITLDEYKFFWQDMKLPQNYYIY